MNEAIERRVMMTAEYIASTGATVRQTARKIGVSKSTVHKDIKTRLPELSAPLTFEVGRVLDKNKAERHLRGGEATRRRFERMRGSTPKTSEY